MESWKNFETPLEVSWCSVLLETALLWRLDQVALGLLQSSLKTSHRWSSTVTACPKALSLWNVFLLLLLLIVTVVLLLCILEKRALLIAVFPFGWLDICYCNASCWLPLAGSASLAPSPFLECCMLQPHSGLTGLPPVMWHLAQFVNTFFFVLGSPKVAAVLLV